MVIINTYSLLYSSYMDINKVVFSMVRDLSYVDYVLGEEILN
jgi:hypothetical protein